MAKSAGVGSNQYQSRGTATNPARRAAMGNLVAASESFALQQTVVTEAPVRVAGEFSFVSFPPVGDDDPQTMLLPTVTVEAARGTANPIDYLRGYTNLQRGLMNPAGPDIWNEVAWERAKSSTVDVAIARDTMTDDEVAEFAYQYNHGAIWMNGEDAPRNRVLFSDGPSADRFDRDTAEEILGAHPWVTSVEHRNDRVHARSVWFSFKVPDDVWDPYWEGITPTTHTARSTSSFVTYVMDSPMVGEGGYERFGVDPSYEGIIAVEKLVGFDPFGFSAAWRSDPDDG